jgi:outer membrane receptor protein involved in Fe transport
MRIAQAVACALLSVAAPGSAQAAAGPANAAGDIEEIVVRARSIAAPQRHSGAAGTIDGATVAASNAEHVHELLVRVPGVWVSRGSGAEHLTAIRSAVLTGSGSCGAFLFLEDGIPVRPQGFCNVNGLFEVMTERAGAVEVVRGPGSALFGGNALHGAINVLSSPLAERGTVSLEAGRWHFAKLAATLPFATGAGGRPRAQVELLGTHSNGYRDDTGFGEQKLRLTHVADAGGFAVSNRLSATLLNQETGGFVVGRNAFRDASLRDTNPNPEAYRDAWSWRATSEWQKTGTRDLVLSGFARGSAMRFLQHFAPGQPLERNGQHSFGLRALLAGAHASAGVDVEWASGYLEEEQFVPATGSAFNVATRPVGVHYDFDVDSRVLAAHYDVDVPLLPALSLVHSGRVERVAYDYDNRTADGNLRPDGTACGFGGCLFSRPADRDDAFTELAGRLGVRFEPAGGHVLHLVAGRGFRPPQTAELYRLQRAQQVADLDAEALDAVEAGYRVQRGGASLAVALWAQRKRHVILRDANGFNVSDGRTSGRGVDVEAAWAPSGRHEFDVAVSHARHVYDFDRAVEGGEVIGDGNDEDTAPRWMLAAHHRYRPLPGAFLELEVLRQGEYFVNAANTADYGGHWLVNVRGSLRVGERVTLFARVPNVLDREYADRADFAFGSYRYFPGEPRRAFVGVEASL